MASLLFFVAVLVHELGHAVVALRHGVRTRSITLFIFGGVALLEKDPRDGRAEFWMAAAGPLVSLTLAGLFYAGASLPFLGPSAVAVARYLALINLILALFNLVPAFPMDGGRLLRGALWGTIGQSPRHPDRQPSWDLLRLLSHLRRGLQPAQGEPGRRCLVHPGRLVHQGRLVASYQQVRLDEALRESRSAKRWWKPS